MSRCSLSFPLHTDLFHAAHAQLHAFALLIDLHHAHLNHLAHGDYGEGIAHEAVVLDADIDESAEIHDIAHRALQDHARLEILHLENIVAQDGRWQSIAG